MEKTKKEKRTYEYKETSLSEKANPSRVGNSFSARDVREAVRRLKDKKGDNYFDSIYTSNRYWVMGKEKMTDKKFQDILTLICEDLKKDIDEIFGEKLI